MSPQQAPPSWTDFSAGLPQDLPDTAYSALQDKFFQQYVAPDAMAQGLGIETVRQQFMDRSKREGKSEHPRAAVVASQAMAEMAAPFAGGQPALQQSIERPAQEAAQEAQRQGIEPAPYQFAGSLLGQAPFWATGMGEAEGLAHLAGAGPLVTKALKTAAGGVIQGTYDLLKTENVIEGLKGAAMGAGMVAGFESLGPLKRFLTGGGMPEATAEAVEAVAKGTASGEQWQKAMLVSLDHEALSSEMGKWVGEQVKAAKQAGVAKELFTDPLAKQLKIGMIGADGKPYQLGGAVGMKLDNIEQIIGRVADHLEQGGELVKIDGNAKAVSQFYQLLNMSNPDSFDLSLGIRDVATGKPSELPNAVIPKVNDEAIKLPDPPKQQIKAGPPPIEVLERLRATLGSDRGATQIDASVNLDDPQVARILAAGEQKGYVFKKLPDGGAVFGEPKLADRLFQASQMKSSVDVNKLINARNSVYHATDLEGFRGILEAGRIKPNEHTPFSEPGWMITDPESPTGKTFLEGKYADAAAEIPDELKTWTPGGMDLTYVEGVSVSRTPRVASKADKAITFVIDQSKMPRNRPYTEAGFEKTVVDQDKIGSDALKSIMDKVHSKGFGSLSDEEIVMMRDLQDEALNSAPQTLNTHFEFENRTYNEPIPLTAVRGIVIDKSAMRQDWIDADAPGPYEVFDPKTGKTLTTVETMQEVHAALRQWPQADWAPDTAHSTVQEVLKLGQETGIPVKILDSGRDVHTYRAGLAKQPEGMRWGIKDINLRRKPYSPKLDEDFGYGAWISPKGKAADMPVEMDHAQYAEQHATSSDEMFKQGWIRVASSGLEGSAEGFNSSGFQTAADLAFKYAKSADTDIYADMHIGGQTFNARVPLEDFGEFSMDPVEYIRQNKIRVGEGPGRWGADITRLGEPEMKIPLYDQLETLPDGTVRNRMTGESFASAEEAAQPSVSYKETPLSHRVYGDIPPEAMPEGSTGATIAAGAGEKPTIMYREPNKELIFHENLHGHYNYLGIDGWLNQELASEPVVHQIFASFPEDARRLYNSSGAVPEEVFTYAASAVRTSNEALLDYFGDADTSKDHVIAWTVDTSKKVLDKAAEAADSLHKRTLERRMNAVITRGTSQLSSANKPYAASGLELDIEGSRYAVRDGETTRYFDSRADAIDHMEQSFQEPLQIPELVPTQGLPDGVTRFATKMPAPSNSTPILTDPPPPDVLPREPIKAGTSAFSFFVRPFYDWLADVSRKFDRPDLYSAFDKVDTSIKSYNNAIRPYLQTLRDTLGKYPHERQQDFFKLLQAAPEDRAFVKGELKFSPAEQADFSRFKDDFVDKLGGPFTDYIQKDVEQLTSANYDFTQLYPKESEGGLTSELLHAGRLDPRDTNLLRVASIFLRAQKHGEIVEPYLKEAEKLASERIDGKLALGQISPLLQRQISYVRGHPDFTQTAVANAVEATIDAINQGLAKVNSKLPDSLQIPNIEGSPQDVLQKFITYQYAGMMGLRPGMLVRNTSQLFLTAFPLLGRYTFTGMKRAFEIAREGGESDAFKIAQQYGAFVEKAGLHELIEGGGDMGVRANLAEKLLEPIRWTDNATRMVSFWGHTEKVGDALSKFARDGDVEAFTRHSDAWFMNEGMRNKYLTELSTLGESSYDDFAKRMAADLTDQSQWNFRKGATPGMYRWQLGRLLGQFGTWPMNYIEYARRFAQGSDKVASMQALTRLALAHGAVLGAGASVGVDTSNWVFFDPMAYAGGPIMQAIPAVPTALTNTRQGSEARTQLRQLFIFPGQVPGGLEAYQAWKAVTTSDPHLFTRIMGFVPAKD